ncbi:MAG: aldehyde dehydrogenase family protein, partial [Candidatus Kapabacteria bacterium]|nr:aldehyde dehydrogenase family protein [Candidatus Kapabacteria bacterium]
MIFTSRNPATEAVIATYLESDSNDVLRAMNRARQEQIEWARRSVEERGRILLRLADILERDVDEVAVLITEEMGKPIMQSRDEVLKCANACRYFAELAPRVLADEPQTMDVGSATIMYQAIGVVVCIMPWNFPLWQFFRFVAPALVAGNGVLLKHAPTTWGCARKTVAMCHEAGVPRDVVQCMMVDVDRVEMLIGDVNVRAVTFTGSTQGGQAVAQLA